MGSRQSLHILYPPKGSIWNFTKSLKLLFTWLFIYLLSQFFTTIVFMNDAGFYVHILIHDHKIFFKKEKAS